MDERDEQEHEETRRRRASAWFWLQVAREAGVRIERDPSQAVVWNISYPAMDAKLEQTLRAQLDAHWRDIVTEFL